MFKSTQSLLHLCNAQIVFFDDQRNMLIFNASSLFVSYISEELDDLIFINFGSCGVILIISQVVDDPDEAFFCPVFKELGLLF